ncbi:MAG: DUF438 domain-containing protein [Alkaliphilus sp.]
MNGKSKTAERGTNGKNSGANVIEMDSHVATDPLRIKTLVDIKLRFLRGETSKEEAKKRMNEAFEMVTAKEFALSEQYVKEHGISDDEFTSKIDDVFYIMDDLIQSEQELQEMGHPIRAYQDEVVAIERVLSQMKDEMKRKFIKNQWVGLYDDLSQINLHFSRKQNQLYTPLEQKGFDRPSRIMWTIDNDVRDIIKAAKELLTNDEADKFIDMQNKVIEMVKDILAKETEILYPTSTEMISEEEFMEMSLGDDEIGYCLIPTPPTYKGLQSDTSGSNDNSTNEQLVSELAAVLKKFGRNADADSGGLLKVNRGELTLEQINLIYKHMPVDFSYVDENDIMKFYTDTFHRVFPRSPGVIGRHVKNCHPRESVDKVEEIIAAFREGRQDTAEFWLDMGEKFVYIAYTAVRDENGKFRGVLEMMQDIKHIKTLTGSQKLVSWGKKGNGTVEKSEEEAENKENALENKYGLNGDTILVDMVKKYPFTKTFLSTLVPKFKKINNPLIYKTMSGIASLDMIAKRGDITLEFLVAELVAEIERKA